MAFASFFTATPSRQPNDESHHSDASTPPGASTPRPDPKDKRFPSLVAGYFGQVRQSSHLQSASSSSSSSAPPNLAKCPCSSATAPDCAGETPEHGVDAHAGDSAQSAMSPPYPLSPASSTKELAPPLLHEDVQLPQASQWHAYPTPPTSSSSSHSGANVPRSAVEGSRSETASRSQSPRRPQSPLGDLPARMRRHTLTANPLASIVSTPTVHASHISNPAEASASIDPHLSAAHRSASHSPESEQRMLTDSGSPRQNTPPHTPRTLSDESKQSRSTSPTKTSPPTSQPEAQKKSRKRRNSTVIGEPTGRLSVSITEARGLRPSIEPFVVCQYQWNEYISKGPRNGGSGGSTDLERMKGPNGETARTMAIPMQSRQNSQTSMSSRDSSKGVVEVTNPVWNHEATFDVVGHQNELEVSVYDHSRKESFLGHVKICPNLSESGSPIDQWFKLESREGEQENVTGEIHLKINFRKTERKHLTPEDFEILKLIGKGTFGQVFQVRKVDTGRVYAMKVLSKKVIVQKKEVAHTVGERNILVRTAMAESVFIVGLKFSFQTLTDLYLVTDYMSGGELFWHLQKEGRFDEARAKFYIAELILALQHLHDHDIVYRDLKPENILLDANGHIALCDFGLSKANLTKGDTTNTFCGTTEYLAPEVLLDDQGYTKMVDFWSLGVLVFEMCCGWSPFYAEDTQQMYKNIAFGKVRFPRDALSADGRNFVKGLLNRNPKHRLGALDDARELRAHPFFNDIDWDALAKKNVQPPFKPRLKSETDTSNFDPEFTNALNGTSSSINLRANALATGINNAETPISPTMQANFKGFTFVDENALAKQFGDHDAMDEEEDDMAPLSPSMSKSSRMSGIQQTGSGYDDYIFGTDGFWNEKS